MNATEERKIWENLPEIYVRLQRDEIGYPPKDWEQLKAEPSKKHETFKIKSIPHYAKGLALEDEVGVMTSDEGYYPVFKTVLKRSGYSTMRLMVSDEEDRQKLIDYFTSQDTQLEIEGRLVALAIPKHKFDEVSEYVCQEKDRGRWDAEDGFLIIDEPI
jgi:hypothetical protein